MVVSKHIYLQVCTAVLLLILVVFRNSASIPFECKSLSMTQFVISFYAGASINSAIKRESFALFCFNFACVFPMLIV